MSDPAAVLKIVGRFTRGNGCRYRSDHRLIDLIACAERPRGPRPRGLGGKDAEGPAEG